MRELHRREVDVRLLFRQDSASIAEAMGAEVVLGNLAWDRIEST